MDKSRKIFGVRIDDAVRKAIGAACVDIGNASELARKLGVSIVLPRQWLGQGVSRPIKTIPHATYERLHPLISAHLPPGDARYLPLSKRPGSPAAAAGSAGERSISCPHACTDAERRIIQYYRDADPDDQNEIYALLRAASRRAKETPIPKSDAISA